VSEQTIYEQWLTLWQHGFDAVWENYRSWLSATESYRLGQSQVGQTPATVIRRHGRTRLLRYEPAAEETHPVPVLCVPSLINRYYILDLMPERSLVRHLVEDGVDLFMLDWGTPTGADRTITLDQHIVDYVGDAVRQVREVTGRSRVTLLGYCMGGMFAAVYTALFPDEVANLVNLAGPINYHDDGIFSLLTRNEWFDADALVDTYGNIPAELLLTTFQMIRPTSNIVRAMFFYERMEEEAFVRSFAAMQTWIFDQVDFPGEAFRRYVKALYQENQLVQGVFTVQGERVDLSRIDVPLLNIASEQDETAPGPSVAILNELVESTENDRLMLTGPHVGMVAGSRAPRKLWPALSAWLVAHSGA
jgi:polyhydroxyalkanoate synthase